ncbi:MAG TPA: YbaN family protein [Anaeromyxobacteraceae bacterium]|nr:YbaN family protein [Anaeromyxobacteraceae bacterium]
MDAARPSPGEGGGPGAARRWVLFGLGWVFVGLGALGAALPVLPATPFLLLALWAFSASSPRFHGWLYHHRLFGAPLRRWHRERTIPLPVKAAAAASMLASLAWLGLAVRPPLPWLAAAVALVAAGIVFLARIPSRRG